MGYFFDWWKAEKRDVIAVEKGFVLKGIEGIEGIEENIHSSMPSMPIVLTGRFDRVERDGDGIRIIDFKTSAARSQESADGDMQLSLYALAAEASFGASCTSLTLLFLSEDGVTERVTRRTRADLDRARDLLLSSHAGIIAGAFAPSPEPEKCRRCPYRRVCDASAV